MYIPLVNQTVAAALSTASATHPAVHTAGLSPHSLHIGYGPVQHSSGSAPELGEGAHVHQSNGSVLDRIINLKSMGPGPALHPPLSSKDHRPLSRRTIANEEQLPLAPYLDPTPADYVSTKLPSQFWPDIPDQKFYRIGEDSLTGCIRDAVKEAGKERWIEIVHSGGPVEFLTKSRDNGLVGEDTNQDSNEVDGLVDWVRTLAEDDNPDLDTATNDAEKCASLVRRFTSPQLVDELIVGWAEREGHIGRLPPTKPEPEEKHVPRDLNYHVALALRGNVTTHGNLTVHQKRDDSKTGPYSNSTASGHNSTLEISKAIQDEDLFLALELISQAEPEIFELFGRDADLVNNFWALPETHGLLYEALNEQQQAGDSDALADPAFQLQFIRDFVQNATDNSFTGP